MRGALPILMMVALSVPCPPVGATTVAPWELEDLAMASDLVIRGEVVRLHAAREPTGRIVTEALVTVREVLRGEAPESVLVTWPGGEIGSEGQRVPGSPKVRPGQEIVAFLARPGPPSIVTRLVPVSLGAGVLEVRRLAEETLLVPHSEGLERPDGLPIPTLPIRLEELREALRSLRPRIP